MQKRDPRDNEKDFGDSEVWGQKTPPSTSAIVRRLSIPTDSSKAAAESDTFQKPRAHFDDDMSPNHLYSYL